MDQYTLGLVTAIGVNYFTQFSALVVEGFFRKAFQLKPSLEEKFENAKTTQDLDNFFKEALGVIDLNAGTDSIQIDNAFLEALRGIRFDHANGNVTIAGTTVSSSVLFTGGRQGATGTTFIGGNTEMKTKGTSIKVGQNCSIKITGNASITQK